MLGSRSSDSLFEVYLILYLISEKGYVKRDEIVGVVSRYREMKADENPNAPRKAISVTTVAISRQIAFLRSSFNIEVNSCRYGYKLTGWGILNPRRFKVWMESQTDIPKLIGSSS